MLKRVFLNSVAGMKPDVHRNIEYRQVTTNTIMLTLRHDYLMQMDNSGRWLAELIK